MIEPPRDLTLPEPGSSSTRRVLGLYLKRVVDDLLKLPVGRFRSQVFDSFADTRAILERLLRERRPGPVFSILRRTTHSTLVRCLTRELWESGDVDKLDRWLAELTALLALELAIAGELPQEGIRLGERPARLLSISKNISLEIDPRWRIGFKPARLVLEAERERVELELETLASSGRLPDGVRLKRPYHPIADGLALATEDNNPLSEFEAHPDKSGNAVELGGRSADEWARELAAALDLVDSQLPELGAEIRIVMQTLVPVGYEPEKHLSASYAEAIGTAYLTLHPDRMTMTEALIHEFSHNKLNALLALDDVLENAFFPLYRSPVRPDPRPLHGILLAVHAFVPVARLYERMLESDHPLSRSPGFEQRLAAISAGNHEGLETLRAHAQPTAAGRALLDELERWDRHFMTPRRRSTP